jgi:hypothetical protein
MYQRHQSLSSSIVAKTCTPLISPVDQAKQTPTSGAGRRHAADGLWFFSGSDWGDQFAFRGGGG